jgi:hypothetical protein
MCTDLCDALKNTFLSVFIVGIHGLENSFHDVITFVLDSEVLTRELHR